jgi:hypothetical protein
VAINAGGLSSRARPFLCDFVVGTTAGREISDRTSLKSLPETSRHRRIGYQPATRRRPPAGKPPTTATREVV